MTRTLLSSVVDIPDWTQETRAQDHWHTFARHCHVLPVVGVDNIGINVCHGRAGTRRPVPIITVITC